jgi:hypothetical protein
MPENASYESKLCDALLKPLILTLLSTKFSISVIW